MKKIIAVAAMAAMVVSMTACGSKAADTGAEATAEAVAATEAATQTAETTEAATENVAANGTLIMATNAEFPPYEYREGDQIVGIDAEIAQAIADELGMELQIEDMQFDSIIAAVQTGKADIGVAGMTVTEDRLQAVSFSDSYTQAAQVIIVKGDSAVATPDDLKGKTVGVQLGTTGDIYAEDIEDVTIDRYNKGFEAVQALLQDKVDAVIIDREPANVFIEENEGLKVLDEEFTVEDYAICMAKDNTDLLDKVNTALASLKESGKLDEIKAKYITAE
ncbi:MAG: basic amino acid ABC transporter substrate-binding protein [Lachnospiraceae bacterium]|nr:basic amino acid ABC transporter substrate-binding protein [Lachnospiraceae bacterium]